MSRQIGARAEQLAGRYLEQHGLRLLEFNFTCKGGEIDLVCQDGGTLVFVEVRARRSSRYGTPEETVSALKQQRVVRAARHYLHARKIADCPCRFDVVAIEGETIRHLPDAFQA